MVEEEREGAREADCEQARGKQQGANVAGEGTPAKIADTILRSYRAVTTRPTLEHISRSHSHLPSHSTHIDVFYGEIPETARGCGRLSDFSPSRGSHRLLSNACSRQLPECMPNFPRQGGLPRTVACDGHLVDIYAMHAEGRPH